jgi:toxin YoeB
MRKLLWQSDAWNEYIDIQTDKALLKRTNKLIKDIIRNGYDCSYGKVELLKNDFSGFGSVRIDQKNRIIFSADQFTITIIQCGGHYND